jgi:4-amino-4-deoxy-L-arabinose transferase-like glycosyltransferase
MRLNLVNAAATLVIVLVALAARWDALTDHDLYNDEALQTTISRSLLDDGSLNNFRYSRFTPDSQYYRGIWIYYPPGFNLIQAVFLSASPASHEAARLPVLVLNLIGLGCLPLLAKRVWNSATPGWIASILGALGVFHISMSVTSVPYTLVAPLLVVTFLALVRAVESGHSRDWAAVAILIVIGFYIMQIALAFCVLLAVTAAWGVRPRRFDTTRGVLICISLVAALCSPWLIWTWGMTSPIGNFLSRAPGYSFMGQIRLVLHQYDLMLPSAIWKLAFLAGLGAIAHRAGRKDGPLGPLLALWALAPFLYVLSRNMWVTPRHVSGAYAPIILIAGLGLTTATNGLAVVMERRGLAQSWVRTPAVAIACAIAISVAQLLASRAAVAVARSDEPLIAMLRGDAAMEFGEPDIVSRASVFIRAHDRGEPVIAPVGFSEAHYLGRFVHDKRTPEARSRAWALARSGPVWVFMGDNYFSLGELDEFDRTVQQHGRLVIRSAPVPGFTAPSNKLGYALYYLDRPLPPAGRSARRDWRALSTQ